MSDQEFLLTTGPGRGTIKVDAHRLPHPQRPAENLSDLEICLMLTRVFLGRENPEIAGNLYRLSRLFKANTETEEEQRDGENRPEA